MTECDQLTPPTNGMIKCSLGDDRVPTNGDTCIFNCDDGYLRRGSLIRKCIKSRRGLMWTGVPAHCIGMYVTYQYLPLEVSVKHQNTQSPLM